MDKIPRELWMGLAIAGGILGVMLLAWDFGFFRTFDEAQRMRETGKAQAVEPGPTGWCYTFELDGSRRISCHDTEAECAESIASGEEGVFDTLFVTNVTACRLLE